MRRRRLMRYVALAREYLAVAVIGLVGTQLVVRVAGILIDGGARPMYIDSWLFLAMLFGDALSVAGLLIGAFAVVSLWLRRRPRSSARKHKPTLGIVRPDGRPLE